MLDIETELENLEVALIKAAIPASERFHKEIQRLVNELHAIHPLDEVRLQMGMFTIDGPDVETICIDMDDNEPVIVRYYDLIDDPEYYTRNFKFSDEFATKIIYLRQLLVILTDTPYLSERSAFFPE